MATVNKNLDNFSSEGLASIKGKKIAILTAEWNEEITFAMRDGAIRFLKDYELEDKDLLNVSVPGSFELIYGSVKAFEEWKADAVIAIGCVIQGETPHFTFISQAVASGLAELNIRYKKPVIFGVLTTLNQEQARERAGGKHGNKGIEAAATLVKLLNM
jgi:6,7-dimethyl-8-ribityllumazine synthase